MTTKQLGFKSPPQLAIAEGAITPDPGTPGVTAWSTTLSKLVRWNGTAWNELVGGGGVSNTASITGSLSMFVGQTLTYTISNYDSFSPYTISVSAGSFVRDKANISVTAPNTAQSLVLTITVDGRTRTAAIAVNLAGVVVPEVTSPVNNATNVFSTVDITTNAFMTVGGADTHLNTDWELWSGPSRSGVLITSSLADATNKVSWTPPFGVFEVSTSYYIAVRHRGASLGASEWGESRFTTGAEFDSFLPIPAAVPAFGDFQDGGYYAGRVWQEVVESSTSLVLAGGPKTFTVPTMTGAPLFYRDQVVEVYQKTNTANKMFGTVTGAFQTQLSINVTSVTGSGTINNWVVRAVFRILVAPKASGETALAIRNVHSNAGYSTNRYDGKLLTNIMFNAGTSAAFPAAHWAKSLTINGKSDWYIPAIDEAELFWRNLKPAVTTTNTIGVTNANSDPVGVAYTSTVPDQVAAGKNFRTGESEAFTYPSPSSIYSTSSAAVGRSEDFAARTWNGTSDGTETFHPAAFNGQIRAVRRSPH